MRILRAVSSASEVATQINKCLTQKGAAVTPCELLRLKANNREWN